MKKLLILAIAPLMVSAFLSSCSDSKQVKTETVKTETAKTEVEAPKVKSGGDNFVIDEINDQIKGFSIDGFHGGSAKLDKNEDLENMKKIVGYVKPIIAKIPAGYVMQITGHCANYDSDATRKKVSKARAEKIYTELKKAGAGAKKMTYRGAGSDELREGYSDKDVKQRRVSFKAVKK